jgi:hypothetical protein
VVKRFLIVAAVVLALRLPFLNQAIQGDDLYYLYGAEHAQIEPLHPTHTRYYFMGDLVDMRGQPHPPLNSWILGGLLALFGDVREVPFHLVYTLFSLIAAGAMLSLARRFSSKPLLATVLFCAIPAFVVNGNSFEADLPFLAFWISAVALFVVAIDHHSGTALASSAAAAGLASLGAYQAIFLTPILCVYLWQHRRDWRLAWLVTFAAPAILATWQISERIANGALPASVLAGYMSAYDLESIQRKTRAIAALVVNLGWSVSPLIVLVATRRSARWQWALGIAAALGAALHDPNPLFWLSIGCGVWLLCWCFGRGFLGWWVLIFFACAVAVFFVGSARYLLPIAAPICILMAEAVPTPLAASGFALQLALSFALAIVNYQHGNGYREFAADLARRAEARRIWINADWGFRWYLEDHGGLPLPKNQTIQAGEIVVTSALANLAPPGAPLAPFAEAEISSPIPLRLMSLRGRSAYSYGANGALPFEVSNRPIDRVRADIAIDPKLTYLVPGTSDAASQIVSGLSADGWMGAEARVLLKASVQPSRLEVTLYVPENSPAKHFRATVTSETIIEKELPNPGMFTFSHPVTSTAKSVIVTLTVDKTFSVPGDARRLGLVVKGIGFRND